MSKLATCPYCEKEIAPPQAASWCPYCKGFIPERANGAEPASIDSQAPPRPPPWPTGMEGLAPRFIMVFLVIIGGGSLCVGVENVFGFLIGVLDFLTGF